jgi:hypothetical protein
MKTCRFVSLGIALLAGAPLLGQIQIQYLGSNATGQLVLTRTVNALSQAQLALQAQLMRSMGAARPIGETPPKVLPRRLRPPLQVSLSLLGAQGATLSPTMQSLSISPTSASFGFSALTHLDQRQANRGNQFSVEPPSQGLAVGNGFVVEGVNNAFQVYTLSGAPVLPAVLSTNELFGLPPAIDRATGINYVFPTDIRVFFDHEVNRWFVLQRSQDNDIWGNPLNSSHLFLAVSQTVDPTGTYHIYTMDTTHLQNPGCPCFADYLQIGADRYGFYISVNEFDTHYSYWQNARILAISKASLASGAAAPTMYDFVLPAANNYSFSIQPATTPPGASYFLANNGVEYFVSSNGSRSTDDKLAVWAMSNTGSLATANPNLLLTQITVPTLTYTFPDVATQRPGPLPYGSSLIPPGQLPFLDGGDHRVLSAAYAGGRLYATLATQVTDESGRSLAGGAYVVLSPTLRGGVLAPRVLYQRYLMVSNNHLLRPAVGVNAQGRGAIVFTLVGPDYYPSAAFIPAEAFSTASTIQIAGHGAFPEDGFTGYPGGFGFGVARWGDYSAAVAASDGSIWMGTEFIPNAPRTQLANWGTYLIRYVP